MAARASIETGAVFRAINRHHDLSEAKLTPDSVNVLLKRLAKDCGLSDNARYSGHSFRRGFVTAAFAKGASLTSVMKQGRWRDIKTVMGYFEESQRFEDNAVDILIKK